jgi:long-chain acyl-CoA synthetase
VPDSPINLLDIDCLIERIVAYGDASFLRTADTTSSYRDLHHAIQLWRSRLTELDVSQGPVGLVADYSLDGIAALIALWSKRACVALVPTHAAKNRSYYVAGHIDSMLVFNADGTFKIEKIGLAVGNPLLTELATRGNPGIVLYSSGSSGEPKAVLHDFNNFAAKFARPGKRLSTYAFLVFDHVAGQDTLLYTISAGGCLVVGSSRRPEAVAALIEQCAVEVLPASPTFLNLLLASGAGERFSLDSIKIITYGSEPMDPTTLARLAEAFPNAKIIQKYGTSEFGAIRSVSRDNGSLFIAIKEDETGFRVENGLLWIKATGAMMGYLNAPTLIDDTGWICTGDLVEQDGRWIRILGRQSDLINVGGEKVVPSEVEAVIQELDFVTDCVVQGEKHNLTGMIVVATVTVLPHARPSSPAERRELVKSIRRHCLLTLPNYKVPVNIQFSEIPGATDRQKKIRR